MTFLLFLLAWIIFIVFLCRLIWRLGKTRDEALASRARVLRQRQRGFEDVEVRILIGGARRYGLGTEYAKRQLDRAERLLDEAEEPASPESKAAKVGLALASVAVGALTYCAMT